MGREWLEWGRTRFRLLVGEALKSRARQSHPPSWGVGGDPGKAATQFGCTREEVKVHEQELEASVSRYIGAMPFLWVPIDDAPGSDSKRGLIERNSIALLSNWEKAPLDPPSASWLGSFSLHGRVQKSGLWNNNHVDESYNPMFLGIFERLVEA